MNAKAKSGDFKCIFKIFFFHKNFNFFRLRIVSATTNERKQDEKTIFSTPIAAET
jgi:hypothetical protein